MNKIVRVQEKSEVKLKALEFSQKCSKETCMMWITFTDPDEIENLRMKSKIELKHEAKLVFRHDVVIRKVAIKTEKCYENGGSIFSWKIFLWKIILWKILLFS